VLDLLFQRLQLILGNRSIEGYLVGGSLRDLLLGQLPQDLDLVVRGDPEPVARALADEFQGSYVALSQEKGVKRVLLPKKPYCRLAIDLAPLHGESITDDLARRDFTINALALPVEASATLPVSSTLSEQPPAALIDPFHGWYDLRARTMRVVQEQVFQHDPLRMLRAIRLSASRQLTIDPATSGILSRDAPLLRQVAPERIRDELLQMLAWRSICALDAYRLLPVIFPAFSFSENPTNQLATVIVQPAVVSWPTLRAMSALLSATQGETDPLAWAEQELVATLARLSHRTAFKKRWKKAPARACTRSNALLLAALLADLAPEAEEKAITAALMRLALGHQATAFIEFLLQRSAVPWSVEARPHASGGLPWRAARYYFERFGERGLDLAVFCLARKLASLQGAPPNGAWQEQAHTVLNLLEGYYSEHHTLVPPALLDGDVLITRLGIAKGPLIGTLLAKVRSAQLDGLIRTREEALQFLMGQNGLTIVHPSGYPCQDRQNAR
jgi:tRNA nucleotidyltransferase/poly(A) polymerase